MTDMTQAPTPGPLSGDDEQEVRCVNAHDRCYNGAGGPCPYCETIAPTAPVEASGSERDEIARLIWQRFAPSSDMDEANALRGEYVLVADDILALRPQPSGETREQVARVIHRNEFEGQAWGDATEAYRQHVLKTASDILALRPAPVASGGQHSSGEVETLRVLLDNLVIAQALSKDIRQKATDEARSYLYDLRHAPTPAEAPVAETAGEAVDGALGGEFRKTATIRAVQWHKMGDHPAVVLKSAQNRYADEGIPWCPTFEGGHVVTPGDWIATGIQGEHWPIKPDVFAATYEAVVDGGSLSQPVSPLTAGLHPKTAHLVNAFAISLAHKLLGAERKYGYSDGWLTDDWEAKCKADLLNHVHKGDPLDVAAYAAFCWARNWSTTPPVPAQDDDKLRIAVEALETIRNRRSIVFGRGEMSGQEAFGIAAEALAALKSTAAQEGGAL